MKKYKNLVFINNLPGAIGLFLLLALFLVFLFNNDSLARLAQKKSLRVIGATATSRTQHLIDTLLVTMTFLDEWMLANPDSDPRFDPDFNKLIDTYRNYKNGTIDIRMVTEEGSLFYFPSVSTEALADVSDREYYLLQKDAPYDALNIGAAVTSRITGNLGVPFTYKVHPNKHKILFLFAVIEFSVFEALYKNIGLGDSDSVSLMRQDNTVLLTTPLDMKSIGQKNLYFEYPQDALSEGISQNKNKLIFNTSLERTPLSLQIINNIDALNSDLFKKVLVQSLIALLVLATYTYLILRTSRLITWNNHITLELERAARFDSLTGLRNRAYFLERMHEELGRAERYEGQLILLILDIDTFKLVNDTYGHPIGDVVLKQMAQTIEKQIRASDISGRIGGEEFAVLLPDTDLKSGLEVAERIREQSCSISHKDWKGSFSIGLALWQGKLETLEQIMKRADDALYLAKRTGRNRVVTAD